MDITLAQYVNPPANAPYSTPTIKLVLSNGEVWSVAAVEGNRHYDEILRQVEAGTLTIADAD